MIHIFRGSKQKSLLFFMRMIILTVFIPHTSAFASEHGNMEARISSRAAEQSSNLIANGSFETGAFTGWTSEGSMSVVNGTGYNNSYGAQMNANGRIYQLFTTTSAKKYTVTGWLRINKLIKAPSWGGIRIHITDPKWKQIAVSPYYTKASSQWVAVSFSFTATASQARMSFENFSGNGQYDAVFDDASVSLSDTPTVTPTRTPTATATRTPTSTPVPATATPLPPTNTPTATATSTPTATALPPTATTIPATATPLPPTDRPTATAISTSTATPLPPTDMPTATAISTSTATALPPTDRPTATATNTSTATPLPPTDMPTATAISTSTATPLPPTDMPTATATSTSTATALPPTSTPIPTRTASPVSSLLNNAGFESGSLSSWEDYGGITVGSTAAFAGSYGARMTDSGRIDQTISTISGQSYTVNAKLRLEQQSVNPSWGGIRFAITNASWQVIASSPSYTKNNASLNQWIDVSFSFTANSTTSRLTFENFSNGKFIASTDDIIVVNPKLIAPTATATATPIPTQAATATSTTTASPTEIIVPTATSTTTLAPTAAILTTPTDIIAPSPTTTTSDTLLESFEAAQSSWLVSSSTSGNATIQSSNTAAEGQTSALLSTSSSTGRAQLYSSFSDSASSHSWEERPGTWNWQRSMVYIPSSTISQLQSGQYFTLAGLYPSAGGSYGWYLRVRQNGQLFVYGYTADGVASEFPAHTTLPLDRWFSLELGLHSQAGPGVKRSFAFLLDGNFYGWYRQGHMDSEIYNRAAFGILDTNSSANLQVSIDAWQQAGRAQYPSGPDNRSAVGLQSQDFRTQSGIQVQYDWSTWALQPQLHGQYGISSAADRIQAGRNLDRMPALGSGWAEIEIDWPQGTPAVRSPQGYFGPMVGFRKEVNREQNLEIIPIGNGNGSVDLALEAWIGSPVILARWPMPIASIGGTSIPEPGDIIRVRWEEVSSTTIAIRASYYDASANQWYYDVINGSYNLSAVSNGSVTVNYLDGYHLASSITIDSPAYSIRRYTVGRLDSYPQ